MEGWSMLVYRLYDRRAECHWLPSWNKWKGRKGLKKTTVLIFSVCHFCRFTDRQGAFKVTCISGKVNLGLSLTFIVAGSSNSELTPFLHCTKIQVHRFPPSLKESTPQHYRWGNSLHLHRIHAHICQTWSNQGYICGGMLLFMTHQSFALLIAE